MKPTRHDLARSTMPASARWAATLVRWGLWSAGLTMFVDQVRPLLADGQFTWGERRIMGVVGLLSLGGFGLAGWLGGRLVRTAVELGAVVVEGAEAAVQTSYLLETQVVPALVRTAAALERLADGRATAAAGATTAVPDDAPAALVRRAIDQGRWGRAEQLLRGLPPADPQTAALATALARARQDEADRLHATLDATLADGDLDAALDARDALTTHLRGGALEALDRRVVRRVYDALRQSVRAGDVSESTLARIHRVVDTFGETPETTQLQRALPELSRQLGLCPSCGGRHDAGACPEPGMFLTPDAPGGRR